MPLVCNRWQKPVIELHKFAASFGKAWWGAHWLRSLDNIDYDNRLPRGASNRTRLKYRKFWQVNVVGTHICVHSIPPGDAGVGTHTCVYTHFNPDGVYDVESEDANMHPYMAAVMMGQWTQICVPTWVR
ncbi:MAG: hypothetical protein WC865_05130 [Bacteroidales bacterium]